MLLELLTSHPNIAGYAAWGLGSLCEATYEAALEALCEEAYNDEDIVVQDFAFSEVHYACSVAAHLYTFAHM